MVSVAVAPGQGVEAVGSQGVQRDVDPRQARVGERLGGAGEADAVGGQNMAAGESKITVNANGSIQFK